MAWFRENPNKEGYYWYQSKYEELCIVKVELNSVLFCGNEVPIDFNELKDGQWWGPIEPPKDKTPDSLVRR